METTSSTFVVPPASAYAIDMTVNPKSGNPAIIGCGRGEQQSSSGYSSASSSRTSPTEDRGHDIAADLLHFTDAALPPKCGNPDAVVKQQLPVQRVQRSVSWQVTTSFSWGRPSGAVAQVSTTKGGANHKAEQQQSGQPVVVALDKLRRIQWGPNESRRCGEDASSWPPNCNAPSTVSSFVGITKAFLAKRTARSSSWLATARPKRITRGNSNAFERISEINPFLTAGHLSGTDINFGTEFQFHCQLGVGAFGSVFLVSANKGQGNRISDALPGQTYLAMKVMPKMRMLRHTTEFQHAMTEAAVLQRIAQTHPFLVNLVCSFQTRSHAVHITEYLVGGELFERLKHGPDPMRMGDVQFYMAQIYLALRHLHSIGVIYRDLKPENVMICADGYVKLIDFGLCKICPGVASGALAPGTFCGTREYMSPEVAGRRPYGSEVDWWAFGVMIYDLMHGSYPYKVPNFETAIEFRSTFNEQARLIVSSLLIPQREHRLGSRRSGGEIAIRRHPFFGQTDFDAVFRKEVRAPFIPKAYSTTTSINYSTRNPPPYFDRIFTAVPFDLPDIGPNFDKTDMSSADRYYHLEDFDYVSC